MELLGLGSDNLRLAPEGTGGVNIAALKALIAEDLAAGCVPMAVVATAGSVDLGRFDDLNALAELARD